MGMQKIKETLKKAVSNMNRNTLGIIICAAVLIITLVVFFAVNANRTAERNRKEAAEQIGNTDLGNVSTVSIPSGKSEESISDDEYQIEIGMLSEGYSGNFVEDGSDEQVKDVLALSFKNKSEKDIQYGEYVFQYGADTVSFKFSSIPKGESCIVLEKGRHKFEKTESIKLVSRSVAQVDELPFAREDILVVDKSENMITVMNLTDQDIPVARVFYKNYNSDEGVFVGGITYTATAEKIPAGSGVNLEPEHFQSGKSVVVGSGVYESD